MSPRKKRSSPRLSTIKDTNHQIERQSDAKNTSTGATRTRRNGETRTDNETLTGHADENEKDTTSSGLYVFDGVHYSTYQEMVNAKRNRNQRKLKESGLLDAVAAASAPRRKSSMAKGITQTTKRARDPPLPRRTSKRLKGEASDGAFVHDERNGRIVIEGHKEEEDTIEQHYRGRVNDGEALSIDQAVKNCADKWVQDSSVDDATGLIKELRLPDDASSSTSPRKHHDTATTSLESTSSSPTSIDEFPAMGESLRKMIGELSVNDEEDVAKVCPDRIYSVAVHPSVDSTIVAAGDKVGYIGLWKRAEKDAHCLFRPHSGAISCLEWNASGRRLWSTSYDGTVRSLDVETEQFDEVFATYDDSPEYKSKLGFGLDTGYKFWTQFGCVDPRNEDGLYVSTSDGVAMHVDLRSPQRITFHHELSDKKINTLSVHPNGHTMVSGGLDCTVAVWDIRNMGVKKKKVSPLLSYDCGRSINSAFLSASGESLICTTMANTLELFSSVATANTLKPSEVIRHDNKTGRWLTTFQAVHHPTIENLFGVGSMAKPRRFDLFERKGDKSAHYGVSGDALTAVVSRLAFHPRSDRIIVAGGNSSGRVTIVQ